MQSRLGTMMILAVLLSASVAGCAKKDQPTENQPPSVLMSVTPGADPRTFEFDATGTTDPDGDPLTYHWNYTTGESTEAKFTVTYPDSIGSGTLHATLLVEDDHGHFASAVDSTTIVLGTGKNANPAANLTEVVRWVKPGSKVTLDASPSKDPDGDPLRYEWWWGPRGTYVPGQPGPVDPYRDVSDDIQVFNTALMDPGAEKSFVFDRPGLWSYTCHPHPWMAGRIIIKDDLPATSAEVDMRGYQFTNDTLELGVGSNVTFHNEDLDKHTASAINYISGTTKATENATFELTVPEGEFVARLFLFDGKGGKATATWGLKGSSDAPEPVFHKVWQQDPSKGVNDVPRVNQNPAYRIDVGRMPFDFRLNYATITYADAPAGPSTNPVNLTLYRLGAEPAIDSPQLQCPLARTNGNATRGPCLIAMNAPVTDEKFQLQVVVESGGTAAANWKITMDAFQFARPDWGDYNAVRCHIHGALVHCF